MHLEALRRRDHVAGQGELRLPRPRETIHTENSHKYGYRDSRLLLLRAAGWGLVGEWADDQEWFSIILAEAEAPRFAPDRSCAPTCRPASPAS